MAMTRIFQSGNSMAVRIPKNLSLQGPDVEIFKRDHEIIIREIPKNLSQAFHLLKDLSDCFDGPRKDPPPQAREDF